jgi:tetratricopeptide (TPR) repeat protein
MSTVEWTERAKDLYERAVFGGDDTALDEGDRSLDEVEAALNLARGRLLHARFLASRVADARELALFEAAAERYRALGDRRGEAEASFWVGTYHQVVRGDQDAALPALESAYALSTAAADKLTMSYAVRHLAFADLAAGRRAVARERLEESVRLRREVGFRAGVAAGLVALAHVTAEDGDRERAVALVDEAEAVARECGARGILAWVDEVRATFSP